MPASGCRVVCVMMGACQRQRYQYSVCAPLRVWTRLESSRISFHNVSWKRVMMSHVLEEHKEFMKVYTYVIHNYESTYVNEFINTLHALFFLCFEV